MPSIREAVTAFTELAKQGLKRRNRRNTFGHGEEVYLKPLEHVIATGKSPAEQSLERFYHSRRSAEPVISALGATGGLL